MLSSINKLYQNLSIPEKNGKKIGKFRIYCSILGGLFVAYLGMSALSLLLLGSDGENIIIPLLFNTMAWSLMALYISISKTKLNALLKVILPCIIFTIIIIVKF